MNLTLDRVITALAAALAVWRFAIPVEKCPISSGPVLYFETFRWLPWTAGCNWGHEVDVGATTLQVAVLLFVAATAIWIGRGLRSGVIGRG